MLHHQNHKFLLIQIYPIFFLLSCNAFYPSYFLKLNIELGADFLSLRDEALEMHQRNQGKLEVKQNVTVTNTEALSLA
ncbi:hypothetical protein, partial [Staphylococcus aureus]|uniref:hypothetical protein n=1 Tax=Staphylococcus aureus TaxID=1280 RepID=UPI00210EF7DD